MMNKRIISISVLLIISLSLSGCRLAVGDGLAVESNRLIGVFITREYLDLFDFEGYFEDNISKVIKGGSIAPDKEERYNGRIYAELREDTPEVEHGDKPYTRWDYVFPDLEGVPFFAARITTPDGDSFIGANSGGAISETHFAVGNETTLEGTLYCALDVPKTYYVNPVYQSSDGSVFLTSGNGYSSKGHDAEGQVFSVTLAETHTLTDNESKDETTERFEVTLHIAVKNRPEHISVIQMDAQSAVITRNEYAPDEYPTQIAVQQKTEYIIVETASTSQSGAAVSRELFQSENSYITCYTARTDGIIEPRSIELVWE